MSNTREPGSDNELTPKQKLINLFSAMADFETENADEYLRSEGLDPEQLAREGSVFIKNIHMRLKLQELVKEQTKYIELLQDECGKGAQFFAIHGMYASPEVVNQGIDCRAKIEGLKEEIKRTINESRAVR